ncbi:penicillin-binding protein 2 [Candidatus Nucleicultrix amoebiphila]|jgi:penicillin-binding protein 2|uniref:penicillin-binding protein 2 n=1 Tax=Candidatus Nucleicultrix amoebiphila TaxID=1509244 RepID=UPI000A267066|nr:penicillin-binding protein 2 [Candidatus Nucleicultrix amoebiphila]
MEDRSDLKKIFTRRSFILAGGKSVLASALISRLYYLGIVESNHYQTLANGNRIRLEVLLPQRGKILDRYGNVMATTSSSYHLQILPEATKDEIAILENLAKIIDLEPQRLEQVLKDIKRRPKFMPCTVIDGLTWDQVCEVEVHMPDLPGLQIKQGLCRTYPDGDKTPHFIGYVQIPSENDRNNEDSPLYRAPNFRLGKGGVEKQYNDVLCGKPGYREIEVNAYGKEVRQLSTYNSISGQDVHLTIDADLQHYCQERISGEHEGGSAVVMDIKNGDVLALASVPTFDPNLFVNGIKKDDWMGLIKNPYGILNNKAVNGLYSPGSNFKMMFAAAVLESENLPHNFETYCHGHVEIGNHRFHCWKDEGHGHVHFERALQVSCDVYFYQLACLVKMEHVTAVAKRFGFGQPTGLELPQEKVGLVPSKSWKKAHTGTAWHKGDTVLLSIGQGSILVTPIQLNLMIARLAANNLAIKPRLIRGIDHQLLPVPNFNTQKMALDPKHMARIKKGLFDAVNSPGGTAYASRITKEGQEMGGKTSTTQVRRITMQERLTHVPSHNELPWQERNHAMFCGFAPLDDPRYAVSVVIEHGGGGGKVAAPIARDIMLKTFERRA